MLLVIRKKEAFVSHYCKFYNSFVSDNNYIFRKFKKTDLTSTKTSTAAVMEGKLKEKLESMAIAALCVAQSNPVVITSVCK